MKRYFFFTFLSVLFGVAARAFAYISASLWHQENVFINTWNAVLDVGILRAVNEFDFLSYLNLRSIIIVPFIETTIIAGCVILSQKYTKSSFLAIIAIILFAYFSHGQGIFGVNATIAFLGFICIYLLSLKFLNCSHFKAIFFTWLTHAIYNFTGVFVAKLITLTS